MNVRELRIKLLDFDDELPVKVVIGLEVRSIVDADVEDFGEGRYVELETEWPDEGEDS